MPIRYSIEDQHVTITCEGEFDSVDIRSNSEEIVKTLGTRPLLRILVEDVDSTFDPSAEELKDLAIMMQAIYRDVPLRIAVHVERELQFGKARMLGAFWGAYGVAYEVFRDREAAEGWLLGTPYPSDE